MALFENIKTVTLTAGESLEDSANLLVKFENDSGTAKVIKTTAATDTGVGFIMEKLTAINGADGRAVTVALVNGGGRGKAVAGDAITAGDLCIPDTTAGRLASGGANMAALAADVVVVGIALESAADGETFGILYHPMTSAVAGS